MKSKLLLSIVAVVSAIAVPMAARGQVAPDRPPKNVTGPEYKYQAYVGYGYTSLNQVTHSRSGLQGFSASITRGFGDHFGLKVDGGHYEWSTTSTNAGNPTVDMFLAGPVIHGHLSEKFDAFFEGMMGGVHTGGVSIQPKVSFAGGIGIGMDYQMNQRWSLRMFGDNIGSAFTISPYQTGYSSHTRWNARAGIGMVYHF